MKRKKAMEANQIFVFIISVAIVALVLILGYNSVTKLHSTINTQELLRFEQQLTDSVKTMKSKYGSSLVFDDKFVLSTPRGFKEVCFVNTFNTQLALGSLDNEERYNLIYQSLSEVNVIETFHNVYVFDTKGRSVVDFGIGIISLWNYSATPPGELGFLCISTKKGYLPIRIKGMGNYVEISALT